MINRTQVRRIEVYLDDDLDQMLSIQSRVERRSKAELVRDAVRRQYGRGSATIPRPSERDWP